MKTTITLVFDDGDAQEVSDLTRGVDLGTLLRDALTRRKLPARESVAPSKAQFGCDPVSRAACDERTTMSTETGIEELRRAARVSGMARESAFDGFTAEQCLNMIRACWKSGWDILPDDLEWGDRVFAARTGELTPECLARLERDLG